MAILEPLTPEEQNQTLGELTTVLVDALPKGWKRLILDYGVIGQKSTAGVGLQMADNTFPDWHPPAAAWPLIRTLRAGMYRQDKGTWYSFEMIVDTPGQYSIKYDFDRQPVFGTGPASPEEYALEQDRFPRVPEAMPDWFRDNLPGAGN